MIGEVNVEVEQSSYSTEQARQIATILNESKAKIEFTNNAAVASAQGSST